MVFLIDWRVITSHLARYSSMIQSHLNYCISTWGFNCKRIYKLQKKIVRIICNAKYNAHSEPLFKQLNILTVSDLFRISCLSFLYKFINQELPEYLLSFRFLAHSNVHRHHTRFNNNVIVPRTRLYLTGKCIRIHVCKIINETPSGIISKVLTHSFTGYIQYAKRLILSSYSYHCNIQNCYICGVNGHSTNWYWNLYYYHNLLLSPPHYSISLILSFHLIFIVYFMYSFILFIHSPTGSSLYNVCIVLVYISVIVNMCMFITTMYVCMCWCVYVCICFVNGWMYVHVCMFMRVFLVLVVVLLFCFFVFQRKI